MVAPISSWKELRTFLSSKEETKKITSLNGYLFHSLLEKEKTKIINKPFSEKKATILTGFAINHFQKYLGGIKKCSNKKIYRIKKDLVCLDTVSMLLLNKNDQSSKNLFEQIKKIKKQIEKEILLKELETKISEQNFEELMTFFSGKFSLTKNELLELAFNMIQVFDHKCLPILEKIFKRQPLFLLDFSEACRLFNFSFVPDFLKTQFSQLEVRAALGRIYVTKRETGKFQDLIKFIERLVISKNPHVEKIIIKIIIDLACILEKKKEKDEKKALRKVIYCILDNFGSHISENSAKKILTINDAKIKNKLFNKFWPEFNFNYLLSEYCSRLIEWIRNPNIDLTKLPRLQQNEAPENLATYVPDFLIKNILDLSNNNIFRMSYYYEPFNFKHSKKPTYFAVELICCLYDSNEQIRIRASQVTSKLSKDDFFFQRLIESCTQWHKRNGSKAKIEAYVNNLIAKGNTLVPKTQNFKAFGNVSFSQPSHCRAMWQISKIYYSLDNKYFNETIENLKAIGKIEGFELIFDDIDEPWLRDIGFVLESNELLVPIFSNALISNKEIKELISPESSNFFDKNPLFKEEMMGKILDNKELKEKIALKKNNQIVFKQSDYYFEGGNLLKAENSTGKRVILCGALNLIFSYLIAEKEGSFEKVHSASKVKNKISELESQKIYSPEFIEQTIQILKITGREATEAHAKITIARMEVIKDGFRQELKDEIVFLESGYGFNQKQLGLHLDMRMMPAPGGVIFLESQNKSLEVLEEILASKKLTYTERIQLEAFREVAMYLKKRDQKRLDAIQSELEKNNFKVIAIPSRFSHLGIEVNYINGICGSSTNGNYIITAGFAGIPGESYLRKAVKKSFQKGGIQTVYFTGKSSEKYLDSAQIDYSSFFNLSQSGSVHCRTLEMTKN